MSEKIKSLNEFIDTVNKRIYQKSNFMSSTHLWFRGQGNHEWDLIPSILRGEGTSYFEREMVRDFQLNSEQHLEIKPKHYLEWLFIMQHYNMPTRLLDWSESYLIALYFAITNYKTNVDAAVWIFDSWSLNRHILGEKTVPTISHPIFNEYILHSNKLVDDEFQRGVEQEFPIALRPKRSTPRIVSQKGTFTLHGHNSASLNHLAHGSIKRKCSKSKKDIYLKKIIIDGESKLKILKELFIAGITHSVLFPELDGISKEISFRYSNQYHELPAGHEHFGF